MSWLSQAFEGNFQPLEQGVTNFVKNPIDDIALAGAVALPFLAPGILGGLGVADLGLGALGGAGAGAAEGAAAGAAGGIGAGIADLAGGVGTGITDLLGGASSGISSLLGGAGTGVADLLGTGASSFAAPGSDIMASLPGGDPFAGLGFGGDAGSGSALSFAGSTGGVGGNALDTGVVNAAVGGTGAGGAGDPLSLLPGVTSGGTGAPASGGGLSLDSLISGATNSITKNPLGIALGAGGLGYSILQGSKNTKNEAALTQAAQTEAAGGQSLVNQGEALTQYQTTGQLPPAYQAQVDQAISSAKANAISQAAANGQPTDPTKNASLAATLAGIDNQRPIMQSQIANQLFQSGAGLISTGVNETGLSGQVYQALVQNDTTQAANTGKAIASLAAALNGKSSANIGGQTVTIGSS